MVALVNDNNVPFVILHRTRHYTHLTIRPHRQLSSGQVAVAQFNAWDLRVSITEVLLHPSGPLLSLTPPRVQQLGFKQEPDREHPTDRYRRHCTFAIGSAHHSHSHNGYVGPRSSGLRHNILYPPPDSQLIHHTTRKCLILSRNAPSAPRGQGLHATERRAGS